MIELNGSDFEKIVVSTVVAKRLFEKVAAALPKVDKTALTRSKKITEADPTSHSLRRVIERSKMPKKIMTEVRGDTEQMYMGGNTAENMRGVMRSEEKNYRQNMMQRYKMGRNI
jgi:hypothetical protein